MRSVWAVHVRAQFPCAVHTLKVRAAVANALGVVAPPDGSACYEVGGMWLPNRLSLLFTGALVSLNVAPAFGDDSALVARPTDRRAQGAYSLRSASLDAKAPQEAP